MTRGQMSVQQQTDRRSLIIEIASQKLNARGVSDEWFGEIAAEIGITRPALYSYFRNRGDLLEACCLNTIDTLHRTFAAVSRDAGDEAQTLKAFLEATISATFPELAVVTELNILPQHSRETVSRAWGALIQDISDVVVSGVSSGRLNDRHPFVIANGLLSLAMWPALQKRLVPESSPERIVQGAREFFLIGIGAVPVGSAFNYVLPERTTSAVDVFSQKAIVEARRALIMGRASALFNRKGIGATSIDDIVAATDVGKKTIFRLFGSKDALVAACFRRARAMELDIFEKASELAGDRLVALHAAVRMAVLALGDPDAPMLAAHVGSGRLSPDVRDEMHAGFAVLAKVYRELVSEGIAQGGIRAIDVSSLALAISGDLFWTAGFDESASPLSLFETANELADIVVRGVLAR